MLQNLLMRLHQETGKTMLFVTHDLIEAVALGDRVVVVSKRPGSVRASHDVPIARPRNVFDIHSDQQFQTIFERVKSEVLAELSTAELTGAALSADGSGKSTGLAVEARATPATVSPGGMLAAETPPTASRWRTVGRSRGAAHVAFMAAFLLVWELASGTVIEPFWVSKPTLIAAQLAEWFASAEFWPHFWTTMIELFLGFAVGTSLAIMSGFAIGESRRLSEFLDPYLTVAYGIPKVALAPLFILWFGIGLGSKVAMGAIMSYFLVFFNIVAGLRGVDPDLINVARVGGASRLQVLTKVKLPSVFPYLIAGVKVALPAALIGVIVAEYISSNRGIGYLIVRSGAFFDTAQTFAGILVLAFVVFALNTALTRLEKHVLRWRPEGS